jgi:hypothetical protein
MRRRNAAYLLLILPFIATLIPSIYNRADPTLFGLPFFYWYQLAWVVITAGILGLVVYLTRQRDDA